MRLFVKWYHKYIKRNEVNHSDKNLMNYRKQENSSKQYDNKKGKSKGPCFNCGKSGRYKANCPLLKKNKGKGQCKKSIKPIRAYIAWENDSESSSEGSSSESDEATIFFLMAYHHKKKNVSHSKYEPIDEMSYSELQIAFENLYGEAIDAFKRLTSNKRIFSYLEAKVLEMESLKQTMLDASKFDVEEEKSYWFGCETCHVWKN